MNEEELARLRQQITNYSGLDAATYTVTAVEQAVAQRLAAHQFNSLADYWPLIQPGSAAGGELNHLVQLLTNKETFFFREMHHFEVLRDRILPELRQRDRLRLWSAGCATGEEAYSLAISLLEAQARHGIRPGEVIGTDIDQQALETARQGCYGERSLRLLSDERRQRYFVSDGQHLCVTPEVARLVTFRVHNLAEECCPPDLVDLDVIFCRNVTIYFDSSARERLHEQLAASLREGGYLFVASAETMGHNRGRLELVSLNDTFVFRKGRTAGSRPPAPPAAAAGLKDAVAQARKPARHRRVVAPAREVAPPADPFTVALRTFQEQDFEAAMHELDRLPAEAGDRPDARCLRAAILLQQGKLDEAEAICRDLLKHDPWFADAYLILGLIHRQQDRAEATLQAFKQAIYLQPGHRDAHFFLAESYRTLGLRDEARREYENTLNTLRVGRRTRGSPCFYLTGLEDDMLRQACEAHLKRLRRPG